MKAEGIRDAGSETSDRSLAARWPEPRGAYERQPTVTRILQSVTCGRSHSVASRSRIPEVVRSGFELDGRIVLALSHSCIKKIHLGGKSSICLINHRGSPVLLAELQDRCSPQTLLPKDNPMPVTRPAG